MEEVDEEETIEAEGYGLPPVEEVPQEDEEEEEEEEEEDSINYQRLQQ